MSKRRYTRWTVEALTEIAKKHKTPGDFYEKDPQAYMAARRKGIFDGITTHMVSGRPATWTKKMITAEAKKYKTRSAFAKGSRAAYSAAARQDILDEVCAHMPKYAGKGKVRGKNARTRKKTEAAKSDLSAMMGLNT